MCLFPGLVTQSYKGTLWSGCEDVWLASFKFYNYLVYKMDNSDLAHNVFMETEVEIQTGYSVNAPFFQDPWVHQPSAKLSGLWMALRLWAMARTKQGKEVR